MWELEKISDELKSIVYTLCNEIGPRSIYNYKSLVEAAHYIEEELASLSLDVWTQEYTVFDKEVKNIGVFLNGAPQRPYYVLGAHYDTVSSTPGADDNASAVAVCFETLKFIVRACMLDKIPPSAFIFFTLEEPPSFGTSNMGSRKFVKWAKSEKHHIKGALVLEMVGYFCFEKGCQKYPPFIKAFKNFPDKGDFIGIIGDSRSKKLVKGLVNVFAQNEKLPVEYIIVPLKGLLLPPTRLSDNASFWDAGYPAVMITDTAYFRNPYYHTWEDTPEKLNYSMMAELVKNLVKFLLSPLD